MNPIRCFTLKKQIKKEHLNTGFGRQLPQELKTIKHE